MAWPDWARAGFAHDLGHFVTSSTNGATATGTLAGDTWVQPFYVPVNRSFELTKAYVMNADTTTDANLVIRVGLYEILSDLTLSLLNDFGTITKDTTAATTLRQVGSNFSRTVGPDKMYGTVVTVEVIKVGATTGYQSLTGAQWGWNPWGALGDNSAADLGMIGNGTGSSGQAAGWQSVAAGGLPSTLAYPTAYGNALRSPKVWYNIATETVI